MSWAAINIGGKTYEVAWVNGKQPQIRMRVKAYGLCLAEEAATPAEARQLAHLLEVAADQAEGRAP